MKTKRDEKSRENEKRRSMTSVVTASAAPLAGIEMEDNNINGFNVEDGSLF